MTNQWSGHGPDLVRDNKLMHERLAEQDHEIQQLHAAVKTAQELAATRLQEIERLQRDMSALQSQWNDMQQGLLELFGEPVQDAIELVGVIEGMRDAHSKEIEGLKNQLRVMAALTDQANARALLDEGPAALVGALQDVVHTDPGPVRAGRSVRQVEPSPEPTPNGRCKCIFCGAGFVMWGDTSVHERSCSKNPVNAVSRT